MPSSVARLNLVAHRGYPTRFPENTIAGYEAAIQSGAKWIETDIQLTRDGHAMLYHDVDLPRISDRPELIIEQSSSELREFRAAHRSRFGDQFASEPIAMLEQLVDLLLQHTSVQAMVELKPQSIDRFGADAVLQIVHDRISVVEDRCVIISLDPEIVALARSQHGCRIGWVLSAWNPFVHQQAQQMRPEFLFGSTDRLTLGASVPNDSWAWAIYSINDPREATAQLQRGISYVETDSIGEMLQDERLASLC